jgi:hypothetical protein
VHVNHDGSNDDERDDAETLPPRSVHNEAEGLRASSAPSLPETFTIASVFRRRSPQLRGFSVTNPVEAGPPPDEDKRATPPLPTLPVPVGDTLRLTLPRAPSAREITTSVGLRAWMIDDAPARAPTFSSITPLEVSTTMSSLPPVAGPSPSRSRRTTFVPTAAALMAVGGVLALAYGLRVSWPGARPPRLAVETAAESREPVAPPTVTPPAEVVAPSPVASAAPSPAADSPVASADPNATYALVWLPSEAKGHRVFIDGRLTPAGPPPLKVKCGKHVVKIGSASKARPVSLPCGGELTLD